MHSKKEVQALDAGRCRAAIKAASEGREATEAEMQESALQNLEDLRSGWPLRRNCSKCAAELKAADQRVAAILAGRTGKAFLSARVCLNCLYDYQADGSACARTCSGCRSWRPFERQCSFKTMPRWPNHAALQQTPDFSSGLADATSCELYT